MDPSTWYSTGMVLSNNCKYVLVCFLLRGAEARITHTWIITRSQIVTHGQTWLKKIVTLGYYYSRKYGIFLRPAIFGMLSYALCGMCYPTKLVCLIIQFCGMYSVQSGIICCLNCVSLQASGSYTYVYVATWMEVDVLFFMLCFIGKASCLYMPSGSFPGVSHVKCYDWCLWQLSQKEIQHFIALGVLDGIAAWPFAENTNVCTENALAWNCL